MVTERCQRDGCLAIATHRVGVGNTRQEHLCVPHTNEREDAGFWSRLIGPSDRTPA